MFEYYVFLDGKIFELLVIFDEMMFIEGKLLGFLLSGLVIEWVKGLENE